MSMWSRQRNERGAIIIHVAMALLALIAFNAFVVDIGVMFVSRRQAQNVADAGALAGAVSLMKDGGGAVAAGESALHWASDNPIWGHANSAANVDLTVSGASGSCGPACTVAPIPPCGNKPGCVRVDVFRNTPDRAGATRGTSIPTFFGHLVGVSQQGVRATATAWTAAGNQIQCLLPFAVIDRFADNYDDNNETSYWPNDLQPGGAGWTSGDTYHPPSSVGQKGGCGDAPNLVSGATAACDVYVPPYGNNANHTGWKVSVDYGRQMILKAGSPNPQTYSTGWSNLVYLPDSKGGSDVGSDILNCNEQPVGIAEETNPCAAQDEPKGCLSVKTGVVQGQIAKNIQTVYDRDPAAKWDPTAPGPNGPTSGAVVGGQGMSSPRIRPLVVVDINHYENNPGCKSGGGSGCIAKVANIIGFFLEGMCDEVIKRKELDDGMACDDPNKQVVGRIVTIPGKYAKGGTGSVDESAAFVKIVQLVR